jgi:hypothetical protein
MNVSPRILFLAVALLLLMVWVSYYTTRQPEPVAVTEAPKPVQKPQDSAAKDADVSFGSMGEMSDPFATAALMPLHMQKLMLDLCGITAADAPTAFAARQAEEQKYLSGMSEKGRQALPGEYAKLDGQIQGAWDKASPEERAKGCADIRAQAAAADAK